LIAVDSQGYLREVRDTHVYPVDWIDKREALQYIHFLKVNEHEMEVLTGLSDPHEAARQLYEWGVKEVLVTLGSMGSLIFDGKDFYRIPAYKPKEVVDATGCGDTYTIGYLYQRVSGAGIEEAGRFAAAMSTLKIEKSGPFNGSKEDVIQCMTTAEQMF
jgi:sugar/nucleoside kinase (ribokinase family)